MNNDPCSSTRPSHSSEQRSFPANGQAPPADVMRENEFEALLAAASRALQTMTPHGQSEQKAEKSSQ